MQSGRGVVLAAGDTFRAAAGEQLESWAERAGARIVRGLRRVRTLLRSYSTLFSTQPPGVRDSCWLITAGRLHTKVNLMDELRKVRRVPSDLRAS